MTQSSVNVNLHPSKGKLLVGDGTDILSELAVGANDTVLTVDSSTDSGLKWATSAGGPAWEYISTATASASAELAFTSGIDSTYNVYWFQFTDILPATNNVDFHWRSSTDGGSTYDSGASDYRYGLTDTTAGIVNEPNNNISNTQTLICNSYLFNPAGTTAHKYLISDGCYYRTTGPGQAKIIESNKRNSTADIDAIKFYMSSGNITSGTIRMYGLKSS